MKQSALPIDALDLASGPVFIATMLAERSALKKRELREFGDLDNATQQELGDPSQPPDPLVPVGYERNDTTASLTMLAGNVVSNLLFAAVLGKAMNMLFGRRVANVSAGRGSWAIAILMWDFLYYWDHRWMHEVRLLWANHVTHHSSERYNLSTALRQPWSGFLTAWVFTPMPLLGSLRNKSDGQDNSTFCINTGSIPK